MIVWNPEPTEYGDFNGRDDRLDLDISVERLPRRDAWSWHAWSQDGRLAHRDDRFHMTADLAKRSAEE